MTLTQILSKLKSLVYSKTETDTLLRNKAASSHTHTKSQITDFPSLATVATSGSYSDLSNKPTIPSNTNQLTNGAGYITSSGSCDYANYSGYVQGNKSTGLYVESVKYGKALVTTNQTGFGAIFNAPTKNYRVACATYPNHDDTLLFYSVTNDNVSSSTNNTNKSMTWDCGTGILTATGFSGSLTGNVTGNCSGSAGSVAWTNVSGKPTIPTKTSQLTNDSGFLTSHQSLSNYLTKTTNVSEMGRYIDMHYDNATMARDYDVRLYVDSQTTSNGGGSFKISAGSVYTPNNLYLGSYRVYVG